MPPLFEKFLRLRLLSIIFIHFQPYNAKSKQKDINNDITLASGVLEFCSVAVHEYLKEVIYFKILNHGEACDNQRKCEPYNLQ